MPGPFSTLRQKPILLPAPWLAGTLDVHSNSFSRQGESRIWDFSIFCSVLRPWEGLYRLLACWSKLVYLFSMVLSHLKYVRYSPLSESGKTEPIPWAVPGKFGTWAHCPLLSLLREKMGSRIFLPLPLCWAGGRDCNKCLQAIQSFFFLEVPNKDPCLSAFRFR